MRGVYHTFFEPSKEARFLRSCSRVKVDQAILQDSHVALAGTSTQLMQCDRVRLGCCTSKDLMMVFADLFLLLQQLARAVEAFFSAGHRSDRDHQLPIVIAEGQLGSHPDPLMPVEKQNVPLSSTEQTLAAATQTQFPAN